MDGHLRSNSNTGLTGQAHGRPGPSQPGPTVALIPAHNEERFIGSLVLAIQAYVDCIVVVDDGSSDHTAEIAEKGGAVVVRHVENQGKAAAVATGFNWIRRLNPSAIVMLDGDGQHYASDIPTVLAPVLDNRADVVIGSRFLRVGNDIPAYRQVGQHSLTLTTNLASGVWVSDSQSGFRAFSARAFKQLSFSQGGFSVESEMQFLVRENKLRVAEVPIQVIYAEPAKRSPVAHGMQVLNGILRLIGQKRPLLFFGATGLMVCLTGVLLGVHVIDIYTQSLRLAVGYALITVLLCVVGVMLFFAGVILHSTRGMFVELRGYLLERLGGEAAPEKIEDAKPDDLALEVGG